MFDNNAEKLKRFAKLIFIVGCVIAAFFGIGTAVTIILLDEDLVSLGLFVGFPAGSALCFLSALLISRLVYGFGEIIENTAQSSDDVQKKATPVSAPKSISVPKSTSAPKSTFVAKKPEPSHDEKKRQYEKAVDAMKAAKTEDGFLNAAELFGSLGTYQDANALRESCLKKAKELHVDTIDVLCPFCNEALVFDSETIQDGAEVTCPFCDNRIELVK